MTLCLKKQNQTHFGVTHGFVDHFFKSLSSAFWLFPFCFVFLIKYSPFGAGGNLHCKASILTCFVLKLEQPGCELSIARLKNIPLDHLGQ